MKACRPKIPAPNKPAFLRIRLVANPVIFNSKDATRRFSIFPWFRDIRSNAFSFSNDRTRIFRSPLSMFL